MRRDALSAAGRQKPAPERPKAPDPKRHGNARAVFRGKLAQISEWRQAGYTLKSIHAAIKDELGFSYNTFLVLCAEHKRNLDGQPTASHAGRQAAPAPEAPRGDGRPGQHSGARPARTGRITGNINRDPKDVL